MNIFLENDLSLESQWRALIQFGKNSATYKFAFAKSLLELVNNETTRISLKELSEPFSRNIINHLKENDKQGNSKSSAFLNGCRTYLSDELDYLDLLKLTEQKGFVNVVDAFQNINGGEIPNPFYQIYEGAAILAGADIHYINCIEEDGFLPDFNHVPEKIWQRCQLLQLCSPGNPTGAVMSLKQMQQAIELADKYDFIVASDECYSEVYLNESTPPAGLLEACSDMGRHDYARCVVFHSL